MPESPRPRQEGVGSQSKEGARERLFDRPWHPAAFALWPSLSLFAANADEIFLRQVVLPAAVCVGAALALQGGLGLVFSNTRKVALALSLLVVLFFSYSALHGALVSLGSQLGLRFLAGSNTDLRHRYILGLLLCLWVAFVVVVSRTRRDPRALTRAANLVSVALVGVAALQIALVKARLQPSEPDRRIDVRGIGTGDALREGSEHPDIYYIILDRYLPDSILRRYHRYDNSVFLSALETRGFFIAPDSRCNYPKSSLSLSSSLNMTYHPNPTYEGQVIGDLGKGHKVGEILKSLGYRYIHIGSWYEPTRSCLLADVNLNLHTVHTEFGNALMSMTPLVALRLFNKAPAELHAECGLFQLNMLEELPHKAGPKLVFAHILLPHDPYVFDRVGNRAEGTYLSQLEFLNERLLRIVDAILEQPARRSVVLLQADEGTALGVERETFDDLVRLRTGIFNAYRFPDGRPESLHAGITPVNSFRVVLNELFGLGMDLLEDRVYIWKGMSEQREDRSKYDFVDATDAPPTPNGE